MIERDEARDAEHERLLRYAATVLESHAFSFSRAELVCIHFHDP